jgi:hypothetical protein
MKIKILKKIRKRFDWYINSEGWPIVLDMVFERPTVFTPNKQDSIKDQIEKYALNAELYLEPKEFAWLLAKEYMINNSGFSYQKIINRYKFRHGLKRLKKGKNFSLKTSPGI